MNNKISDQELSGIIRKCREGIRLPPTEVLELAVELYNTRNYARNTETRLQSRVAAALRRANSE